jgi:hypothetical protein
LDTPLFPMTNTSNTATMSYVDISSIMVDTSCTCSFSCNTHPLPTFLRSRKSFG